MAAWECRAKRAFTAWSTADLLQLLISLSATWCRSIRKRFQNLPVLLTIQEKQLVLCICFLHLRIKKHLATVLALYLLNGGKAQPRLLEVK